MEKSDLPAPDLERRSETAEMRAEELDQLLADLTETVTSLISASAAAEAEMETAFETRETLLERRLAWPHPIQTRHGTPVHEGQTHRPRLHPARRTTQARPSRLRAGELHTYKY